MKTVITMIVTFGLLIVSGAEAKTLRATEMNSSLWQRLSAGSAEELVVEFHQGDELPVSFNAAGDLLETSRAGVSYISVKRNFWIKLKNNDVQISFDGNTYKAIKESLTGSLSLGAGADENGGIANTINVGFEAKVK